jgi:hypothetical protein
VPYSSKSESCRQGENEFCLCSLKVIKTLNNRFEIWIIFRIVNIVPDGILGKCLDPGIHVTGLGKNVYVVGGGGGGNPSQALPTQCSQKSSNRNPAAMEEVYLSYSSKAWQNRFLLYSQQSENNILLHKQLLLQYIQITSYTFLCFVQIQKCCISSRRINHLGAQLHALILCLCTQDSWCLKQWYTVYRFPRFLTTFSSGSRFEFPMALVTKAGQEREKCLQNYTVHFNKFISCFKEEFM